jgi:hypothetical protein
MSHRFSKWMRDAEAARPLMKVTCQHPGCDYCVLSTDPELTKVHHSASRHFGHPHSYTVLPAKPAEADNAAS